MYSCVSLDSKSHYFTLFPSSQLSHIDLRASAQVKIEVTPAREIQSKKNCLTDEAGQKDDDCVVHVAGVELVDVFLLRLALDQFLVVRVEELGEAHEDSCKVYSHYSVH